MHARFKQVKEVIVIEQSSVKFKNAVPHIILLLKMAAQNYQRNERKQNILYILEIATRFSYSKSHIYPL